MAHDIGQKRAAMEPAIRLLGHDTETLEQNTKRPITISVGAVMVFLRALSGLLWLGSVWILRNDIAQAYGLDPSNFEALVLLIVGVGFVVVVVLAVFAWLIFHGSNFARVVTMIVLSLSIILSAIEYYSEGLEITLQTSLLTLGFDILVLLALSSRDARAWARRKRH